MKRLIRKILKEEIEFNYGQEIFDERGTWDGNRFILGDGVSRLEDNIIEIKTHVNDEKIKELKSRYPNKWILANKELELIWIKDKPELFWGEIPEKVYHVSKHPYLDEIGIKPSSETETPLGYYNISFFYLDFDDAFSEDASIPYIEGKTHIYEITTDIPDVEWYEGFNYSLDFEENITTNSFINPLYIKKISPEEYFIEEI